MFLNETTHYALVEALVAEALQPGGRLTVGTSYDQAAKSVKVTIEDTGVGIALEEQESIFEKFRQGAVVVGDDGLTRRYSGTGLGLSIVKELCRYLTH